MAAIFGQSQTWWVQPKEDGPWRPILGAPAVVAALQKKREVFPLGRVLQDMNVHPPRGIQYLKKNPTLGIANPPQPWCISVATGKLYEHVQAQIWFDGESASLAQGRRIYLTQAELTAFVVSCANTSETISGYEPSKIVDARDRDEVRLEEERDAARAKIEMEGFIVDSEDEEEEDGSFSGSGSEDEQDGSGSEDDDESSAGSSVMSCEPPPKQPKKRRVIADDDSDVEEVKQVRGQDEVVDIEALRRWTTGGGGGGGEDDPIEVMSSTRSVHGEEEEEETAEAEEDASRDMLMTISLAPSPIPTPSEFSSVAADVSAMSHREGPSPIVVMSTEMLTPPPNHAWIGPNLVVIPPPPPAPVKPEADIPEEVEEEEPMLTLEDVVRAARASV